MKEIISHILPPILIVLVTIIQFIIYILLDLKKLEIVKPIIFLLVLFSYLFYFPNFYFLEPDPNEINCGNALIGIYFFFWIFGGFSLIVFHISYYFFKKKVLKL